MGMFQYVCAVEYYCTCSRNRRVSLTTVRRHRYLAEQRNKIQRRDPYFSLPIPPPIPSLSQEESSANSQYSCSEEESNYNRHFLSHDENLSQHNSDSLPYHHVLPTLVESHAEIFRDDSPKSTTSTNSSHPAQIHSPVRTCRPNLSQSGSQDEVRISLEEKEQQNDEQREQFISCQTESS